MDFDEWKGFCQGLGFLTKGVDFGKEQDFARAQDFCQRSGFSVWEMDFDGKTFPKIF